MQIKSNRTAINLVLLIFEFHQLIVIFVYQTCMNVVSVELETHPLIFLLDYNICKYKLSLVNQ